MDPGSPERIEETACEACWGHTRRVCSRCGRRICVKCSKKHRMGIIEFEDLPEDAKPVWCAPLTPGEKRYLDRLPLHESEVRKDTYQQQQALWIRLVKKRYARWEVYPQPIGSTLVRIR